MRLVDANELEKWMNERMRSLRAAYGYHDAYTDGFEECMEAVENAETIDPEILAEHLRSCGYEVRKCQH